MRDQPDLIRARVMRNLGVLSPNLDAREINEVMSLEVDLGMTNTLKRALAPGFQKISRQYNAQARVTMDQCNQLRSVQDCLSLVAKASKLDDFR